MKSYKRIRNIFFTQLFMPASFHAFYRNDDEMCGEVSSSEKFLTSKHLFYFLSNTTRPVNQLMASGFSVHAVSWI